MKIYWGDKEITGIQEITVDMPENDTPMILTPAYEDEIGIEATLLPQYYEISEDE